MKIRREEADLPMTCHRCYADSRPRRLGNPAQEAQKEQARVSEPGFVCS